MIVIVVRNLGRCAGRWAVCLTDHVIERGGLDRSSIPQILPSRHHSFSPATGLICGFFVTIFCGFFSLIVFSAQLAELIV